MFRKKGALRTSKYDSRNEKSQKIKLKNTYEKQDKKIKAWKDKKNRVLFEKVQREGERGGQEKKKGADDQMNTVKLPRTEKMRSDITFVGGKAEYWKDVGVMQGGGWWGSGKICL